MTNNDEKITESLVRNYKSAKDKELVKATRNRKNALKEKIKIGDTLKGSGISKAGATPDIHKTRVDAARAISRVQSYPAEKRRILSIVANDFSYPYLGKKFGCSSNTITAARVHAILFCLVVGVYLLQI